MIAIKKDMDHISGVVNVLLEHEYTMLDRTPTSWVFESKNPDGYAFVLPAAKKHVPIEIVRNALCSEPLDIDDVVEQSVEKSDEEAAFVNAEHPTRYHSTETLPRRRPSSASRY